ncbi:MAG: ribose 5-phosphate isomerase B [Planctomycetota bacterium]|jgi:ribose 5-phosphate isomerase B
MKIALGSDHAGFDVKQALAEHLAKAGHEVHDVGCHDTGSVDYPDYAHQVAGQVARGDAERGILVCGTGLGMSMAANRQAGVRAAVVWDRFSTEMSREHNDANVLCVGARVLDKDTVLELADLWIATAFGGDRHARRVAKIEAPDLAQT